MKNKTTKETAKRKSGSAAMKIGIIGASAAALAATYFFLGPKGKQHQKQTKAWATKMKSNVLKKLKDARNVSEPIYHQIIDSVAVEYKKGKRIDGKEINSLVHDLKKHWKAISSAAKVTKRDVVKDAKKVVKKAKV